MAKQLCYGLSGADRFTFSATIVVCGWFKPPPISRSGVVDVDNNNIRIECWNHSYRNICISGCTCDVIGVRESAVLLSSTHEARRMEEDRIRTAFPTTDTPVRRTNANNSFDQRRDHAMPSHGGTERTESARMCLFVLSDSHTNWMAVVTDHPPSLSRRGIGAQGERDKKYTYPTLSSSSSLEPDAVFVGRSSSGKILDPLLLLSSVVSASFLVCATFSIMLPPPVPPPPPPVVISDRCGLRAALCFLALLRRAWRERKGQRDKKTGK